MKRWYLSAAVMVLLALAIWACLPAPFIVTVHAQTLPATKTLAWDCASCAADGVTGFQVTLDGATAGTPTGMTQAVTFTTAGAHTLTVRSVNLWGTSTPATLQVNVVVPTAPANMRIQ